MSIKNIIFDLCGPILTIDINLINHALKQYGILTPDAYQQLHKAQITERFEAGQLEPHDFCNEVRHTLHSNISDEQIFDSWNTLITDFPVRHIELLKRLKSRYRLFLLSNSDIINAHFFTEWMNKHAGFDFIGDVFEHAYFSWETGLRKPNPDIFRLITNRHLLNPKETLMIDDSPKHVAGAATAGLNSLLLQQGVDITDLFDDDLNILNF